MKDYSIKEFFSNHYQGTRVGLAIAAGKSKQRLTNMINQDSHRVLVDGDSITIYKPLPEGRYQPVELNGEVVALKPTATLSLEEAESYTDGRRK